VVDNVSRQEFLAQ